jgi:hypothetical protein
MCLKLHPFDALVCMNPMERVWYYLMWIFIPPHVSNLENTIMAIELKLIFAWINSMLGLTSWCYTLIVMQNTCPRASLNDFYKNIKKSHSMNFKLFHISTPPVTLLVKGTHCFCFRIDIHTCLKNQILTFNLFIVSHVIVC